jgi:hypothetical protein
MFNRKLEMRVVKDKNPTKEPVTFDQTFEGKTEIIGDTIDKLIRKAGLFCLGFIVLDTTRQVLVAKASK